MKDPIVDEIRDIRQKTIEACGHDLDKLIAHYQQWEHRVPPALIAHRQPKRKKVEEGTR